MRMKIFLMDQERRFDMHLRELIRRPVMSYDRKLLKEKISTIDIRSNKALRDVNVDFLFDYKIFPPNIMSHKTQWSSENREMKIGDTILQQAYLPPIKSFSQKIIFGVRINSIIKEDKIKGYSYETIEGHVEKGESIFTLGQNEKGLIFRIHTHSKPGTLLSKLVGPLYFHYPTKPTAHGRD